jgi:hypothetical protein
MCALWRKMSCICAELPALATMRQPVSSSAASSGPVNPAMSSARVGGFSVNSERHTLQVNWRSSRS